MPPTPERLRGVMTTEFYTLQYHVYILALHLYLGQRLPNYDFDRHIGGAFYIFTRGIESETRGTVFDQPQRALVETLAAEFKLGLSQHERTHSNLWRVRNAAGQR